MISAVWSYDREGSRSMISAVWSYDREGSRRSIKVRRKKCRFWAWNERVKEWWIMRVVMMTEMGWQVNES